METKSIGIATSNIPTIASGQYHINVEFDNNVCTTNKKDVVFHVEGYNHTIPQNEVLTVYPPQEHKGNFAGTFPHIQFRRSTFPWEYEVRSNNKRLPYLFLVLLKEEEISNGEFLIKELNTNDLLGSIENPNESKPLKILSSTKKTSFYPDIDLVGNIAHVRVQKHSEIKDLNLPTETSILIANRMVEPNTKYKVFVCYYAEKLGEKYKMIQDLNHISTTCVVLHEWSFESITAELYQIDLNKLKTHPKFDSFAKGLKDSKIDSLEQIKLHANAELKELIEKNEQYLKDRNLRWQKWDKKNNIKEFEQLEKDQVDNSFILEYLEYNGKNLKGYLHELDLQPFKTSIKSPALKESASELKIDKDPITRLLDAAKIPLEHQLKAGGKIISWYQGPFTKRNSSFNILQTLKDKSIDDVPDHADYLILFNEDTNMFDMTYSAAWQLGRLLIMNDNKVLQELKKWKYDLELHNLILEQNKYSHLPNFISKSPEIPQLLLDYITELVRFRNFPINYLFPHADLNKKETIQYFKIDNSWILAFLFGIFSAGPTLSIVDFEKLVLNKKRNERIHEFGKFKLENNSSIKQDLKNLMDNLSDNKSEYNSATLLAEIKKKCEIAIVQAEVSGKDIDELQILLEALDVIKNEFWFVFNANNSYYGILLQSQTIKNWPHLIVELDESHDFHYVTTINSTLRLYITDKPFFSIEMYLKNENAHFGMDYKGNEGKTITVIQNEDSAATANKYLYKQPRVVFNIKS
ncbi:hypothetical protein [Chryseobacterium balustinum]|uniref:Uncharacterized protein n=1 Tax=Chryseobacterium balustinum TaxID=246 RepID=A0AAX2ILF4_9FLAO|nr:hypothetical protein [Chryseobacterium balustinum]AZB29719.1 hypothetical protein EB354_10895 [Chryseobacterium balustinum]SKB91613.1 hypothetical protein SAMN05421800_11426 [Chryseobacterium balustinum]SQA90080.1 Uncharacterised protein [Chryseobacterium balustinum]